MRKILVFSMVMALMLFIGTAFADEMRPILDTGTQMYVEAFPTEVAPIAKNFSPRVPIESDALVETGTALYNAAFPAHKPVLAEKSVEGAAAGGAVREDENTVIWDKLLAPKEPSLE